MKMRPTSLPLVAICSSMVAQTQDVRVSSISDGSALLFYIIAKSSPCGAGHNFALHFIQKCVLQQAMTSAGSSPHL